MRTLFLITLVLMLVLGVAVGYFNAQPVSFNYLAGSIQLPLVVLVVGEALIVALLTLAMASIKLFKLMAEIRRLKRQVKDHQGELAALRNLPLRDGGTS